MTRQVEPDAESCEGIDEVEKLSGEIRRLRPGTMPRLGGCAEGLHLVGCAGFSHRPSALLAADPPDPPGLAHCKPVGASATAWDAWDAWDAFF